MTDNIIMYIFVFIMMVIFDVGVAIYTKSLADRHYWKASFASTLTTFLQIYIIIYCVKDTYFIIPACLGSFVGTYISKYVYLYLNNQTIVQDIISKIKGKSKKSNDKLEPWNYRP